jgi:hypothetical protein
VAPARVSLHPRARYLRDWCVPPVRRLVCPQTQFAEIGRTDCVRCHPPPTAQGATHQSSAAVLCPQTEMCVSPKHVPRQRCVCPRSMSPDRDVCVPEACVPEASSTNPLRSTVKLGGFLQPATIGRIDSVYLQDRSENRARCHAPIQAKKTAQGATHQSA